MPQAPANRAAVVSRPPSSSPRPQSPSRRTGYTGPRRPSGRTAAGTSRAPKSGSGKVDHPEHEILFQKYFKSVGPRTYASQVKRANNGNHYLVLTEGKRDESTGEVRKTRLFVYSEDFVELFKMLQATAQFIKANPVPDEVKKKRDRYWAKKAQEPQAQVKAEPAAPQATAASAG